VEVGTDKVGLCASLTFLIGRTFVAFTYHASPLHCPSQPTTAATVIQMRTDAIRPRIAQFAEARSCFCYTVACPLPWLFGCLTFCLSRNTGQQPQSKSRSDRFLPRHALSPDSLDRIRSHSPKWNLAGWPTTRTCVPLANISKPHGLPLLTSFHPAQLRPFSGLFAWKESKKKETRRDPSPLLPLYTAPIVLCARDGPAANAYLIRSCRPKTQPQTRPMLVGKRKVKSRYRFHYQ